ncbi:DUF3693 domain-containing protein [Vibrio profundum]|uniref:DUF3693 domain-containing protein n=1 Tax=Vibrio profundum TaxID=2910247 RepID=UPI003D11DDEE
MYQSKILDAYKQAKNYIQDKQIAHDLGISTQKISKIRNGERHLTENEALFLAEQIGITEEEVLVYLAADKSKDHKAQKAWAKIAKSFNSRGFQAVTMSGAALTLLLTTDLEPLRQYALCMLC